MAGDWLKIEHETPDKPEVLRIAALLGITLGDAFLGCFKAWRWCDAQSYERNAPGVTPALLDSVIGRDGFALAMQTVGWLTVTPEGILFPNAERHMTQTAKTRALNARRVRRHRSKGVTASVTDVTPEALHLALPREDKREDKREEEIPPSPLPGGETKSKPKRCRNDAPMPDIPPALDTPEFRTAWADWLTFRAERKPKVTPCAAKEQFRRMAEWGPARAVAAIRNSIANSYQGIFENGAPHKTGNGTPSKADAGRAFFAAERAKVEAQQSGGEEVDL